MSGISKIVDERIEQLRKEKIELDNIREDLKNRELLLAEREAAVPVPAPSAPATAQAPPKRGRGRPRKGESPNIPPLDSEAWRKAAADMARLRAIQFADLAAIEGQKLALLEEIESIKARDMAERERLHLAYIDDLAKLKLQKMAELEQYLEEYREECFANIQADLRRQRELNAQRAAEFAPAEEAAVPRKTRNK
ncbi:MAG: hypothetical protein FWE90_06450 [Defluviitaleaceae bacterium]|nr:hypothetical protein [Defluviitaleaceae bacterium]